MSIKFKKKKRWKGHDHNIIHTCTEGCTCTNGNMHYDEKNKNKNKEMKKTFDAIELDKFWSYRSLKPSDRYPPL